MVQRVRDLAGDEVGLVTVGQGDDDIGIIRPGAVQDVGIGGMADHRANVEAILQLPQNIRTHVDHRDFIGFLARQVVGGRGADLAGAENQDLHC